MSVCEREEVVRRGTERAMWKERRERLMKMIFLKVYLGETKRKK